MRPLNGYDCVAQISRETNVTAPITTPTYFMVLTLWGNKPQALGVHPPNHWGNPWVCQTGILIIILINRSAQKTKTINERLLINFMTSSLQNHL